MPPKFTTVFVEHFWSKVDRSGGPEACWLWQGKPKDTGYGQIRLGNRTLSAHRTAYELTHGPIPAGLFVCHNCPGGDNPLCCNPAHHFLGTVLDNARDGVKKGQYASGERNGSHTHPERVPRGENHPMRLRPEVHPRGSAWWGSKVNEGQVREIRERAAGGETMLALSREFGLTHSAVQAIVHRRSWKHVA